MSPARLRSLSIALFALNVAYTTTALFVDALPGWKMFASAPPLDVVVTDERGVWVDPRAYLPKDAQILDRALLTRVVAFACAREPARGTLSILDRKSGRTTHVSPPRCEPDAPR